MPGKPAPSQNGPQQQQDDSVLKSLKKENFDPDDLEYIKDLQRPAVIKEDLHLMECSRRVKQILDSQTFREELEKLILSERGSGGGDTAADLKPLEQLSDLLTRTTQPVQGGIRGIGSHAIVPIADLRGADGAKFSKQERILRNKFASLFRLIDLFRWSQGISNHCSLRISNENILINPFCLMYHEVSAGLLLKVDFNGNPVDESTAAAATSCGINDAAFIIHAAIYKSRPDVTCIVHLLTPVVGAVAAMKCGLMPISQEAMIVGEISYHDFQGYCIADPEEAASVAKDLGLTNKVLLMRNNGFLICASSVEEAFHLTYNLILACETQVRAVRAGFDNLVIPSQEAQRKAFETATRDGGGGVNKTPEKHGGGIKWKVGELEWEAWMRVLDNAGFRTGHMYRQSLSSVKKPTTPQSEVAIPPAATSYVSDVDAVDTVYTGHKIITSKSDAEKMRWLHSPNLYQKVEYNQSGSAEPKIVTKWVQNESPAHMQPIKVHTASHQFLPPSSVSPDPKELKDKQKKFKELRSADNISAGPQSKVLEGVSVQDAIKMKESEATDGQQERIIIGAASKGIIDRDYRHNQQIFSQLYQTNPFAQETEQGIQKYMTEVEQKTRVLTYQSDSGMFDRCDEIGSGGSQSPESVSLMQAAREHNLSHSIETPPPSHPARETTFEATTDSYNVKTTVSPSKQFPQQSPGIPEEKALSEDEAHAADGTQSPDKKDKKKKKFRTLSFLKSKKDKEKK